MYENIRVFPIFVSINQLNIMWQRVQTLYLGISTLLIALMFFINKAVILGTGSEIAEEIRYLPYVPYLILIILITLLNLLALTTYKIRVFQMRTAILAALITLALQGWIVLDYFTADDSVIFKASAIFPLISVICDILAAKNIYSDELMVQSFNSLRTRKKRNRKKKS